MLDVGAGDGCVTEQLRKLKAEADRCRGFCPTANGCEVDYPMHHFVQKPWNDAIPPVNTDWFQSGAGFRPSTVWLSITYPAPPSLPPPPLPPSPQVVALETSRGMAWRLRRLKNFEAHCGDLAAGADFVFWRGMFFFGDGFKGKLIGSVWYVLVVQSRPFDLLVFPFWSIFSHAPKRLTF